MLIFSENSIPPLSGWVLKLAAFSFHPFSATKRRYRDTEISCSWTRVIPRIVHVTAQRRVRGITIATQVLLYANFDMVVVVRCSDGFSTIVFCCAFYEFSATISGLKINKVAKFSRAFCFFFLIGIKTKFLGKLWMFFYSDSPSISCLLIQ